MRRLVVGWLLLLTGGVSGLVAQDPAASPHGRLEVPCADCHQPSGWKPAQISSRFDHGRFEFPLEGAHVRAPCLSCHQSMDFAGAEPTCASCHRDVHQGELGVTCSRCHTARSFADQAPMFRAHQETRFPLEGPHLAVDCRTCHTPSSQGGLTWLNRPTTCVGCHLPEYRATDDPPHVAAEFSTNCTECHTGAGWGGAQFDHATTGYPLVGAHVAATCADCHADGIYRGHQQSCIACHQANYDQVTVPDHRQAGFPLDCTTCHTNGPVEWRGAHFDHDATQFPLTGAHIAPTCTTCHVDGIWRGTVSACVSCHQPAFDQTTNPSHPAARFPTDCTACHTTTGWPGAGYDHTITQFPLTGAHRAVTCRDCHADGVFQGKPAACISCHQVDYDRTTVPDHRAGGFPTDCTQCHSTVDFRGASFNHDVTQFPLTGLHRAETCLACHGDGVYRGKPTTCVSCHLPSYDQSARPPHRSLTFPTDCVRCHTTAGWPGAPYDHSTTQFPLTGAHGAVSCQDCHANGVYRGKPTTCVSCHQPDYDRTVAPNHQSSGFPTDCTQCHTTTRWPGAAFNHDATPFPLTGSHRAVSCQDCHVGGVFRGTPTTCVSCHQTHYDQTVEPPHRSLAFPTDCQRCHTAAGWPGALYEHSTTQFPLTGAHIAASCRSCHADRVYTGKSMACASCHQQDYDTTTDPNHRTAMFPTDCQTCHVTSTWLGARFDHDGPWFEIYSGKHRNRWTSCTACHTNSANYSVFTCLTCHLKPQMDDKHKERAGYSYTSQACYTCHPRGSK